MRYRQDVRRIAHYHKFCAVYTVNANHYQNFDDFLGLLPPKFNCHYSGPQKAHPWVKSRRLSHQP